MHALSKLASAVALSFVGAIGGAVAEEPAYVGTWSGEASDVKGREITTYPVVVTLNRTNGTIEYPSLNCGGRLTGIGQSSPYVFFIESITHGGLDEVSGTAGCISGAITVRITGDKLGWGWVGVYGGQAISANAVLTRKAR